METKKYKTVELGHISFSGKSIHRFCDELREMIGYPLDGDNIILQEVEGKENVGLMRAVQRIEMTEAEVKDAQVKELQEKFTEVTLKLNGVSAECERLSEKLKAMESSVKTSHKFGKVY